MKVAGAGPSALISALLSLGLPLRPRPGAVGRTTFGKSKLSNYYSTLFNTSTFHVKEEVK